MDSLDERTKLALRRLAKSVAIITTRWKGKRYAMAATAVEGLSLDPPSLLICVNKTASLAQPLADNARFAVNLLGDTQGDLPARCSAPWNGEDRFSLGDWGEDAGAPILSDAQASFVCMPEMSIPYGTHYVVIGRIEAIAINGEVGPLVFADGAYHRLSPIRQ